MLSKAKDIKIGFIGAGKVGFSLGRFLVEHGTHVTGYYSRHGESACEAARFTSSESYDNLEELVNDSDALFLTVPDGEIQKVYDKIKDLGISDKYICHCSGSLSSKETFPNIDNYHASGYSIHPLFPVSSKYESYKELSDAFFCLEGSGTGIDQFKAILENAGAKTRTIKPEVKALYHLACVYSSNLMCGLVKESMNLLTGCGFTDEEALMALKPLMLSNMAHIGDEGPVKALTGPIERGDSSTIEKHIKALNDAYGSQSEQSKADEEITLYKLISSKVLECAKEKNPDRNYSELEEKLN